MVAGDLDGTGALARLLTGAVAALAARAAAVLVDACGALLSRPPPHTACDEPRCRARRTARQPISRYVDSIAPPPRAA